MNTPEKQAAMNTTVGRLPQALSIIVAMLPGAKVSSPSTMPSGEPWLVK